MKPTEAAEKHFNYALQAAKLVALGANKDTLSPKEEALVAYNQAVGLAAMSRGLAELSIGVRACYNLLEEVKALLERPGPR